MTKEIPLTGGNTTVVVRRGDTVRRPVGPWTPAVHDLLRHLENSGFDQSPRVLGIDDQHREVLQFVDGEVGTLSEEEPLPAWFASPEACWSIGRWIADFQAAQAGFVADPNKPWRQAPGNAPGEVLVHHDVSPYNTVLRQDPVLRQDTGLRTDGSLVVLDWDFTRPGAAVDDLAWAAWRWAPLQAGSRWHRAYAVAPNEDVTRRQRKNLAALIDGYGPSIRQRAELGEAIGRQMSEHAADLEDLARSDPAFVDLLDRDFATLARQDAAWWATSRIRREVLGS